MHSKNLQMSGLKCYQDVPTFNLCCCVFSSPGYWMNIFVQRYKTVLNNFKVFKDEHGVSFLQIQFVARGLLCDILLLYYNMVNQLLLSYLSHDFHVSLCFPQHLCHNTLFLRRWYLWSFVLWFHMLTLFNCKSSLVRFSALVCYCGISRRWIVPICVKSVDLFLDVQCSLFISIFVLKQICMVDAADFFLQKDFYHLKSNHKGIFINTDQRF